MSNGVLRNVFLIGGALEEVQDLFEGKSSLQTVVAVR